MAVPGLVSMVLGSLVFGFFFKEKFGPIPQSPVQSLRIMQYSATSLQVFGHLLLPPGPVVTLQVWQLGYRFNDPHLLSSYCSLLFFNIPSFWGSINSFTMSHDVQAVVQASVMRGAPLYHHYRTLLQRCVC